VGPSNVLELGDAYVSCGAEGCICMLCACSWAPMKLQCVCARVEWLHMRVRVDVIPPAAFPTCSLWPIGLREAQNVACAHIMNPAAIALATPLWAFEGKCPQEESVP